MSTVPYLQHFEHGIRYRTSSHSLKLYVTTWCDQNLSKTAASINSVPY